MLRFKFPKIFISLPAILVLIIIIASLLRFVGTVPGYPPIHTDEGISHSQGIAMILEKNLDPKKGYGLPYNYPILVPLVNAIFYLLIFIPVYSLGFLLFHFDDVVRILQSNNVAALAGIFDQNILGPNRINVVYWGRLVTALVGVGVVMMSYLVSKQLFRLKAVGLLSAFLVATNYRQVLNSHFGLPDIYNAFTLLMALLLINRLWIKQSRVNYFLAGISIAVFFSTKFQLFALPPLLIVLIMISLKVKKWLKRLKYFFSMNMCLMVGVIIITTLLLNFFHILHWNQTFEQVKDSALKYRYGKSSLDLYSLWYLYHVGVGPIMSFTITAGILLGLKSAFRQTILLLSVIVPFLWLMVYYTGGGFYTRNFVTITPVLLVFAAFGLWRVLENIKKNRPIVSLTLGIIILSAISYEALSNSIFVPLEYIKPWNFKETQKWVGQNIPPGSLVVANPVTSFFGKKVNVISANKPDDYFLKEMQEKNAQYAVINLDHISGEFLWWMTQDFATSRKLGWFPVALLSNTPLAKMTIELKNYIIFEALNPWQAPDNNFLVVKIPPLLTFENGGLIYEENFNNENSWVVINDNFGSLSNFSWDSKMGYKKNGSLKIAAGSGGVYSQRFVSPKIAISADKVYQINGMMNLVKVSEANDRDGFLEADFLSKKGDLIRVALSSRVDIYNQWINKEVVVKSPPDAEFLQLVFQRGRFDSGDLWIDDVQVWESVKAPVADKGNIFIKSRYNPAEHLFLNSNGGM